MKTEKKQIRYFFDKEADVLYFSQSKASSKDISQEIGEGVVVRLDSITKRVKGFTILNFLKRQKRIQDTIRLPLKAEFEMAV